VNKVAASLCILIYFYIGMSSKYFQLCIWNTTMKCKSYKSSLVNVDNLTLSTFVMFSFGHIILRVIDELLDHVYVSVRHIIDMFL